MLQSLVGQLEDEPHYWASSNPNAEVDFLIEYRGTIIPIEVKSSRSVRSPSMKVFREIFKDGLKLRIRYSLKNLSLDGDLLNIPLFMVDETTRLIDLAMEVLRNNREKPSVPEKS